MHILTFRVVLLGQGHCYIELFLSSNVIWHKLHALACQHTSNNRLLKNRTVSLRPTVCLMSTRNVCVNKQSNCAVLYQPHYLSKIQIHIMHAMLLCNLFFMNFSQLDLQELNNKQLHLICISTTFRNVERCGAELFAALHNYMEAGKDRLQFSLHVIVFLSQQ